MATGNLPSATERVAKRKLKTLPLKTKIELIEAVETSGKKQKTIAEEYGIPQNTVSTIMKKKDHYRQQFYSGQYDVNTLRIRHFQRDRSFPQWFLDVRAAGAGVSLPFLTVKANSSRTNSGMTECRCRDAWMDHFQKAQDMFTRGSCSDLKAVDLTIAEQWKDSVLRTALMRYRPCDVFHAGENGLFWRLLPDKVLAMKSERCQEGQRAKERFTVLCCTNMDGSEKWPLLIVGKIQTPRCFKGLQSLPTKYAANGKAWMSQDLFLSWLHEFDLIMAQQRRKVLLVLDNRSVHPVPTHLQATELLYLPHYSTVKSQPCDMGVFHNLKIHYRFGVMSKLQIHMDRGLCFDDFRLSLLDAVSLLSTSWTKVSSQIIQESFRKVGFVEPSGSLIHRANGDDVQSWSSLQLLIGKLCEASGLSLTVEDIVNVDQHLFTCPTENSHFDLSMVALTSSPSPDIEDEDDLGEESPVITRAETAESMGKLLLYLLQKGCSDELSDLFTRFQIALESFQQNS